MNACLSSRHISTEGLDGALEIARALIKNGYQVFIQEDDANIYVVDYAYNDPELCDSEFALLTQEEMNTILYNRQYGNNQENEENN